MNHHPNLTFIVCTIRLNSRELKNLRNYLESPLEIVNKSRYEAVNQEREKRDFVIGVLNDVEIHFLSSQNTLEVVEYCNNRIQRINWDNIFITFNQHNYEWEEKYLSLIAEFDKLYFDYKICFSNQENLNLESAVLINKRIDYTATVVQNYSKYFDIIAWLNKKYGNNYQKYRVTSESV